MDHAGSRYGRGLTLLVALAGAILCPLPGPSALRADQGRDRLGEILKGIEANERLYQNIEVIYEESYSLHQPNRPWLKAGSTKTRWRRVRTVLQGDLFFHSRRDNSLSTEGRKFESEEVWAYDGRSTHTRTHDGKVGAGEGRREGPGMFRPHTWLLPLGRIHFPLSLLLHGAEKLRSHPLAGSYGGKDVGARVVEEAVVEGLPCVQVRFEIRQGERVNTIRDVWVATNRNYLPVKTVAYVPYYSRELPLEEGVARDFKEVKPGVWLARKYRITVYDEKELLDNKRAVVSNTSEAAVTKVNLEPKYEVGFFRDVKGR
jgi:hypothetical protein